MIGKCLRRSDNDRLSGVNSHRINILHVAHRNAVVCTVAHDLIFYFFPTTQILLNQYLIDISKHLLKFILELSIARNHTGTLTTERESCSHHYGVADLFSGIECLCDGARAAAFGGMNIYLTQLRDEKITIFRITNRVDRSPEYRNIVFFKNTLRLKCKTEIKRGLTAE